MSTTRKPPSRALRMGSAGSPNVEPDPLVAFRELMNRFGPGSFTPMHEKLMPAVLVAEAIGRLTEATDRLTAATEKNTAAINYHGSKS